MVRASYFSLQDKKQVQNFEFKHTFSYKINEKTPMEKIVGDKYAFICGKFNNDISAPPLHSKQNTEYLWLQSTLLSKSKSSSALIINQCMMSLLGLIKKKSSWAKCFLSCIKGSQMQLQFTYICIYTYIHMTFGQQEIKHRPGLKSATKLIMLVQTRVGSALLWEKSDSRSDVLIHKLFWVIIEN